MEYQEFIHRVRQRAGFESEEEAIRITEAVLETLGERLGKTEQDDLESQLPKALKGFILKRRNARQYSLEEFYNRVGARADIGYPHAVEQSRIVMEVLQEAVSSGERQHLLERLPDEYAELFGKEAESPLSPSV